MDVPKASVKDALHAVGRAATSCIPILGSPAAELFDFVFNPPLEKRRNAWCVSIGERLSVLEAQKVLNIEDLQSNEAFITATTRASQAALRTHHEEKLEALRNAVLNSALPHPPEESLQQIFIQWVDEMTVDHIRFLLLFRNPLDWFQKNHCKFPQASITSSLSQVLLSAYPQLGSDRSLYELIASELSAKKLFTGDMHTMMSSSGVSNKRTTELGDRFVDFITAPST